MSRVLNVGSQCSGIEGIGLGLEQTGGFRLKWVAEIDKDCSEFLKENFNVPNHGNVKKADWKKAERVDVLTAGYPCQPFSHAGKRRGKEDERHLWPYIFNSVKHLRPRWVFFENVSGHITLGLREVLADLKSAGYTTLEPLLVEAATFGSPQKRERVIILAYCDDGYKSPQEEICTGRDALEYGSRVLADSEHDGLSPSEKRGSPEEASAGREERKVEPCEPQGDGEPRCCQDLQGGEGGVATADRSALRRGNAGSCVPQVVADSQSQRSREAREHSHRSEERAADGDQGSVLGDTEHHGRDNHEVRRSAQEVHEERRLQELERSDSPPAPILGDSDSQRLQGHRTEHELCEACGEEEAARDGDVPNTSSKRLGEQRLQQGHDLGESEIRYGHGKMGRWSSEPRLGGSVDGFPYRLHPYAWPLPPGPYQWEWEPPRICAKEDNWKERLQALGNAVVPHVGALVGWIIMQVEEELHGYSEGNEEN